MKTQDRLSCLSIGEAVWRKSEYLGDSHCRICVCVCVMMMYQSPSYIKPKHQKTAGIFSVFNLIPYTHTHSSSKTIATPFLFASKSESSLLDFSYTTGKTDFVAVS